MRRPGCREACSWNTSTRVVFPMPASPVTKTTCRWPSNAFARWPASWARSASRHTRFKPASTATLAGAALVRDGADKLITPLGDGADELGPVRPVAQNFADLQNVLPDPFGVDIGLRPQRLEDLIRSYQTAGMLDQKSQDSKAFRSKCEAIFGAPQTVVLCVQTEGPEVFHFLCFARMGAKSVSRSVYRL